MRFCFTPTVDRHFPFLFAYISGKRRDAAVLIELLSSLLGNLWFFILNVSAGSFPRPLSAREEADCLAKKATGDRAARNKLIEHNLRLVAHIIKKYYATQADQDDLVSIGTIGLIKAFDTFDASKGTRLSSYAARCIENEILMYFRSTRKTAQDVSISDPIDTDRDGNALTFMDIIACDDTIADDLDLKMQSQKLHTYIPEVLDRRERQIICMRYGLGNQPPMTQQTVAEKLNISRSYVSRLEKRALEKLRARFERADRRRLRP
jgi:RNA polymerase sporulation-specific sigma factor